MQEQPSFLTRICIASLLLLPLAIVPDALGQLRISSYNIAHFNGDQDAFRHVLEALHSDDIIGFSQPCDIMIFQEVREENIVDLQANIDAAAPRGIVYTMATFTSGGGEDFAGGGQACFYRSDRIAEIPTSHLDISTGANRDTDRWLFRMLAYSSTDAYFFIYSSHLKAGTGSSNEADRTDGVNLVRNNANALPAGSNIIYVGDMNFYSNNEDGYQAFIAPGGQGQAIDPYGTGSWGGSSNAIKHTQSPRDVSGGGLIGGGCDDRFDFHMPNIKMFDGNGLSMIDGSCRAVGNDGLHYDDAINDGTNTYLSNTAESNALADAMFQASDHLPVLVEYQVPAVMTAFAPSDFGRVIVGAEHFADVYVKNIADHVDPIGVDELEFTATGQDGIAGSLSSTAPLDPDFVIVQLPVDTSTSAFVNGTVQLQATSEATQNSEWSLPVAGEVLDHAAPSFSGKREITMLESVITIESGELGLFKIPIHNFQYDSLQAELDVISIDGLAGFFYSAAPLPTGIGDSPGMLQIGFDSDGLPDGEYSITVDVIVSDEALPGAEQGQLQLDLVVNVGAVGCPFDLDSSGGVDGADLALFLGQWGRDGSADFSGNSIVDGEDLAMLLGAWGSDC